MKPGRFFKCSRCRYQHFNLFTEKWECDKCSFWIIAQVGSNWSYQFWVGMHLVYVSARYNSTFIHMDAASPNARAYNGRVRLNGILLDPTISEDQLYKYLLLA